MKSCTMPKIAMAILLLLASGKVYATHNRAGEIRYRQINDLTIIAELITYTKTSSISADRDTLTVIWGDGTSTPVPRENGKGSLLSNDIKMNIYEMQHTYPGRGEYTISMFDPNRVEDILNVDPPNSVNIPFFIQSVVRLFSTNFQGLNQSPVLTNPPIDIACLGQIFIHNPGASDPDGDSLSFSLVQPLMDLNTPVPNYLFPYQVMPGLNNQIFLNTVTGTFTWNAPRQPGEYNIAIEIREYRKGQQIGSIIRDMQILVLAACQQDAPPLITGRKDTCIVAGTRLRLGFSINDPDAGKPGGKVKTQAFGAPFFANPAATTNSSGDFDDVPYEFEIVWQTDCPNVRNDHYSVIIKSTDDFFDTTGLSNTFICRIKVVGPAPEDLRSDFESGTVRLSWKYPYACDSSSSNFRGFSVWRRESPGPSVDTCHPGLENSGYQRISYLTNDRIQDRYVFNDTGVLKSHTYCYRVQAEFANITPAGFLYNFTPSLPSSEVCAKVLTNEPLMLIADVANTDGVAGSMMIKYRKPFTPEFDTLQYGPPYSTRLLFSADRKSFSAIRGTERTYQNFGLAWDTVFVHDQINTQDSFFSYYVELNSSGGKVNSEQASQIRLDALNYRKGISLDWQYMTPWSNENFTIFKSPGRGNFDSIAVSRQNTYIDRDITFDSNYCYFVTSHGKYFDNRIENPLINRSNIVCVTATDSTPPCCPTVTLLGPCEKGKDEETATILLKFNEDSCSSRDISFFRLYEKNPDGKYILVDSLDRTIREIHLKPKSLVTSCYITESINSKMISCQTEPVCISQCPEYLLPNTFTPNGDMHNDVFRPIVNRQVARVEFIIINKWGNEIYRTTDPELNWDGRDKSGQPLSDGTYYYKCRLYFLNEASTRDIAGFIELLKGR